MTKEERRKKSHRNPTRDEPGNPHQLRTYLTCYRHHSESLQLCVSLVEAAWSYHFHIVFCTQLQENSVSGQAEFLMQVSPSYYLRPIRFWFHVSTLEVNSKNCWRVNSCFKELRVSKNCVKLSRFSKRKHDGPLHCVSRKCQGCPRVVRGCPRLSKVVQGLSEVVQGLSIRIGSNEHCIKSTKSLSLYLSASASLVLYLSISLCLYLYSHAFQVRDLLVCEKLLGVVQGLS